ncbi:hypothetical protein SKAU_G00144070 [Synaphobranchus kaupii]|uniref:DUF7869 domain-containing protein n=1 Tax=Synaphobranchus kaupii TaxID=118154 RepID=A0A9Q1FSR6_SYNKA|nr:hypothetical protein SKAU_G00144070 [Synaphobranchus kaupii]
MCVWHEGIAHRGSVEVASCLMKWVQFSFAPLVKPKERKLVIFSDRCCGQNNNWRMLNLMALLTSMGYFTEIEHKFMVSGHSFLPCDRSFAIIEKRRKVSTLHTPEDFTEMIIQSKQEHPFRVMQMKSEDFRLFPDSVLKKPAGLQITSKMWFKVTAADPWNLHTKVTHSLYEGWKSWLITKPQRGQPPPALSFAKVYARAYESPLPVKKEKHQDLMSMLTYLPPAAQAFYQALECEA